MIDRIPEDIRSDIRFTAFFIGNGTLLPRHEDIGDYDIDYGYRELLAQEPRLLEQLVSVYLNVLRAWDEQKPYTPNQRAAQWMLHTYDPRYQPTPPFAPSELTALPEPVVLHDYFDAVKWFARQLTRGFPDEDLLKETEFASYFWEGGSYIESFFAVFCNVLHIDEHHRPLNTTAAMHRTAQFIRYTVDSSYRYTGDSPYDPQPPFADWEIELV